MAIATFQEGVSGYAGTNDAYGRGGANANTNYNSTAEIQAKSSATAGSDRGAWLSFDISSIPAGATITAVTLTLYWVGGDGGSGHDRVFPCLRTFNEAQVTFNIYTTGNSWTTAGGRSNGNDMTGVYSNDSGNNRLAEYTSSGLEIAGDTIVFTSHANFITYIQAQLGGTANFVIQQNATDENLNRYGSSEAVDSSKRPLLTVTYTPATGAGFMSCNPGYWGA